MPQTPARPEAAYPDIVAEIGSLVGLSRPAGQCFAAIWRAAQPPCADDLTRMLGLSRSNVSTALRELRDWGLISRARAPADRKDYFTAPPDPWDAVRAVLSARQRRSVAPILDRLLAAGAETGDARIAALHTALGAISARMEALAALDAGALSREFAPAAADRPAAGKKKKKKRKA